MSILLIMVRISLYYIFLVDIHDNGRKLLKIKLSLPSTHHGVIYPCVYSFFPQKECPCPIIELLPNESST